MANNMSVPLTVPGVAQAVQQLNQVAQAYRNIGQAQQQAQPRISGPFSGVARAQNQLQQAFSSGSQTQVLDAQYNLSRAQARLARATAPPPSPMSRLGQMALSSRFNIGGQGGGVSPLVGRALSAAGVPAGMMGPIGLAAGAAALVVTALKALAVAANEGGQAIKALRDAATLSGGSMQQAAELRTLGITAERAGSLRERMATDPQGMLAAARLGIRALPTQFGSQNNADVALQVVEALKRVQNPEERLRTARMLGAEDLLPLVDMSDKARDSLKRTSDQFAAIASTNPASVAADLDASWRQFAMAGDAIKAALFNVFGDDMVRVIRFFSDAMMVLAQWINENRQAIRLLSAGLNPVVGLFVGLSEAIKWVDQATSFFSKTMESLGISLEQHGKAIFNIARVLAVTAATVVGGPVARMAMDSIFKAIEKSMNDPTSANTKALNNNTQATQQQTYLLKAQIYGGGGRAGGALPSGMSGMLLNQAATMNAVRLGYWTL